MDAIPALEILIIKSRVTKEVRPPPMVEVGTPSHEGQPVEQMLV